MKTETLLWMVTILSIFENAQTERDRKQRGLDMSFLNIFGDDLDAATDKPSIAPRSSRARAKDDEASDKQKCKCQERASRRLRREIKDVEFRECPSRGTDSETSLRLSNITLGPTPLIAPGDLLVYFDAKVKKELPRHIEIDVDVYKYMFDTLPVSVPCMVVRNTNGALSLGSCTYRNICQSIENSACQTFKSNGSPCMCGKITPGEYSFRTPLAFIIPNMNSIFDILVKGSYKMRAAITNSRTKQELGCVEATWKITKVHKDKQRALFFKQRKTLR